MDNVKLEIPAKLIPVFTGPARYRGAYGGRGGAKSIAFARMAAVTIMQPQATPKKFLCTRELQKSLKDSVFDLIATQIRELGLEGSFDIGKEYIRCKNGNEFLFYGLRSNIAEIKGLHGVKWVWNEEAQKTSQLSLDYLLPTIREENSELWFTWNPDDELDPVHKMLVADKPDNAIVVCINWQDNPWFPKVLEDERLRTLAKNPARYEWIWEGKFNINAEGAVYAKWLTAREKAGAIRSDLYNPALPVHTAWDLGHTDYTAIWFFQVLKGEVRYIDYYENNREGLPHYAEHLHGYRFQAASVDARGKVRYERTTDLPEGMDQAIAERRRGYSYGRHHVPHDAAHKLFAAGGRSIVEQGKDFGLLMFVTAALKQQTQIAVARKTLEQAYFDPVNCADGLRALRKYEYEFDDDKQRYRDAPLHNWASHGADAFELSGQVWQEDVKMMPSEAPIFFENMSADQVFWPENKQISRERI